MTLSIRDTRLLIALGLGLAAALSAKAEADAIIAPRPILLELFTSQSCSSCPPAEALLRELSNHPDLLPLSFHVDYWNETGWIDPYSAPAFTARQQDYAGSHGYEVYTPQLVVDGHGQAVGSDRAAVAQAIEAARNAARAVPASIHRQGEAVRIHVGTLAGSQASGSVYLLTYDSRGSTHVPSGENAGRNLPYTNVVRSLRRLGDWSNQPLELNPMLDAHEVGDHLAVLVQDKTGTVWALASSAVNAD
jgi:hypothetical protein